VINSKDIKKLSEDKLKKLKVPVNVNLPPLEDFSKLNWRPAKEIAARIVVLSYIVGIGHHAKRKLLNEHLKTFNLDQFLSPAEHRLLNKWILKKQDQVNAIWASEAIEILGWSIGLWDEFEHLKFCDEDRQISLIPIRKDPAAFIASANLIEKETIYQEADLIFRLHWLSKREDFGKFKTNTRDVYHERHRAINWIIDNTQNWDDVNNDT
jgi:hypothetical protein